MDRIIGLGEIFVSANTCDVIKTFALASCIGITAYSVRQKVGGMAHIVLPYNKESIENPQRPAYYANDAVPLLIRKMCESGCLKGELKIAIYGGAQSIRKDDYFTIGKRNADSVLEELVKLNLNCSLNQTGGFVSRTISMEVRTGCLQVDELPITC